MVEQPDKDRPEIQGQIVPEDLQAAEEETLLLFESLSSAFPDKEVDANLLSQATSFAAQNDFASAVSDTQVDNSNVVSLYAHEREISFGQVLPKVFVAAAVVVLAIVVVPLLDNTSVAPEQIQATSSSEATQYVDESEKLSISSVDALSETSAESSTETSAEANLDADATVIDTDASEVIEEEIGAVTDSMELSGIDADAQGDSRYSKSELQDSNLELQNSNLELQNSNLELQDSNEANRTSSDTANIVTGVARTTIISTESVVSPTVVQGVNLTSAARVQRKANPGENSDSDESTSVESTVSASAAPEPSFLAPQAVAVEPPAYRRSVHRWKAEILKLSRLGLQQQVKQEYRLFIQRHPSHAIKFEEPSAYSSDHAGSIVNPGVEGVEGDVADDVEVPSPQTSPLPVKVPAD